MSVLKTLGVALFAGLVLLAAAFVLLLTQDFRGKLAPRLEAMAKTALDRDVSIGGSVRFGLWPGGPSLKVEDIRVANASWGSRPTMVRVGRAEMRIALRQLLTGEVAIDTLLLQDVDAYLETQADGLTNRPRPGRLGGKAGLFGTMSLTGPERLEARDVFVSYRSGPNMFPLELGFDRLALRPQEDASLRINLQGAVERSAFAFDGKLAKPLALIRGEQSPLEAVASVGNTRFHIKGMFGSPARGPGFTLNLDGAAPDLTDFGAFLGVVGLPKSQPVSFSAVLEGADKRTSISSFIAHIGTGAVAGEIDIGSESGAPSLYGVFASEMLDLAPFIGARLDLADFAARAGRPFAVDLLRRTRIDITYQAQLLKLGNAALEAADLRVLLANGVLTFYPVTVFQNGVPLEAEFSIDFTKEPRGELRMVSNGFELGPLLEGVGYPGALSGPLGLAVELSGQGESMQAILENMQGSMAFAVKDGAVGADAVRLVPAVWGDVYRALGEGEASALSCARFSATFKDGAAEARSIFVDTGRTTTMGAARLDLDSGQLTSLLSPRSKDNARTSERRDLALDGAFAAPQPNVVASDATPEALKPLIPLKSGPGHESCVAKLENGLVPRIDDPSVTADMDPKPRADRAGEGSRP